MWNFHGNMINNKTIVEFSVTELTRLAKELKRLTSRSFFNKNKHRLCPGDSLTINRGEENEIIIKVINRRINIV